MQNENGRSNRSPTDLKPLNRNRRDDALLSSRRHFLQTAAGAGLAFATSPLTAWADHHGHPIPNRISYLHRGMRSSQNNGVHTLLVRPLLLISPVQLRHFS